MPGFRILVRKLDGEGTLRYSSPAGMEDIEFPTPFEAAMEVSDRFGGGMVIDHNHSMVLNV